MVSIIWKPIFLIFAASTNIHAIKWTKHEVLDVFNDVLDNTPLECNRENGYDFNDVDSEAFLRFDEAMKELDRPVILENAISIELLKKYTVTFKDGRKEKSNLVMFSGGSLTGNCFYLKKLAIDEFCIYTIPSDIDLKTRLRQRIHWTEVEVTNVLLDSADSLPLESNQENGYDFLANYDIHFVGAMKELGRPILDGNTVMIEPLKKYTVKHKDGRTEKLNLVQCLGGGLVENNFYLQKVRENDFRIYTVIIDDYDSFAIAQRLAKIRWTKKEVLSVACDATDNRPSNFNEQNGYNFEGSFDLHFIGAMKELGRRILPSQSFMIDHLKKYTVTFADGHKEELNLVLFVGGGNMGNRFFLQEVGENNYCIYTMAGDDNLCSAESICWSTKEVLSVTSDPANDTPLEYSLQNGYYFEGNYDFHFIAAMEELDRPVMLHNAFVIRKLRKYTVKYKDGHTEELNLVEFSGGGEVGNIFYLQQLGENNFCIYTVLDYDDPSSSSSEKPVHIRWTKREVLTVYSIPGDDIPSQYGQRVGYYFEGSYHVHFVGAMRELGRQIRHNVPYRISDLRKYTVKYRDDRTEQLNLVRFVGGSEPGNRFYVKEVDENNYCIYTVVGDDEPSITRGGLTRMYRSKKKGFAPYLRSDARISEVDVLLGLSNKPISEEFCDFFIPVYGVKADHV